MTETITRRVSPKDNRSSFTWHRRPSTGPSNAKVCKFWLAGNCRKNPCRFLHPDVAAPINRVLRLNNSSLKQSHEPQRQLKHKREYEVCDNLKRKQKTSSENVVKGLQECDPAESENRKQKTSSENVVKGLQECDPAETENRIRPNSASNASSGDVQKAQCSKVCQYWLKNSCVHDDKCKFLHSWSHGDGFSMLAQLQGHKKAVTGITLPSGSDKLFSSSKDGTVRAWNCHSGECIGVADVGAPVECLISEGPWVFAGLTNAVKAWKIQTNAEITLSGPAGQVYALAATDELLLAGVHDGSILVWKMNSEATSFDAVTSLKGHTAAVVSLIDGGANRLYSGSMDKTVRVWDLNNMKCIHTLAKHSEVVMSVLCWEQYLLSCSLDQSLKVWAATEAGELKDIYEHKEEHGILSLRGMHDTANKPILLCSCNDNTVRLYELPSFVERGRIFAKQEVRAIHVGPGGLFFTGDGTGLVSVWKSSSGSIATPDTAT